MRNVVVLVYQMRANETFNWVIDCWLNTDASAHENVYIDYALSALFMVWIGRKFYISKLPHSSPVWFSLIVPIAHSGHVTLLEIIVLHFFLLNQCRWMLNERERESISCMIASLESFLCNMVIPAVSKTFAHLLSWQFQQIFGVSVRESAFSFTE